MNLVQVPFWPEALTTMGRLFPYAKGRAGAGESAIAHFREAARADSSSSLVWEMLGEMLAPSDPAGAHSMAVYQWPLVCLTVAPEAGPTACISCCPSPCSVGTKLTAARCGRSWVACWRCGHQLKLNAGLLISLCTLGFS